MLGAEPSRKPPTVDPYYPVSELYLDTQIVVAKGESIHLAAEEILAEFECMLKLFQPGLIFVRTYHVFPFGEESKGFYGRIYALEFLRLGDKPEPAPLYDMTEYCIDDNMLAKLKDFYNQYFDIIKKRRCHCI